MDYVKLYNCTVSESVFWLHQPNSKPNSNSQPIDGDFLCQMKIKGVNPSLECYKNPLKSLSKILSSEGFLKLTNWINAVAEAQFLSFSYLYLYSVSDRTLEPTQGFSPQWIKVKRLDQLGQGQVSCWFWEYWDFFHCCLILAHYQTATFICHTMNSFCSVDRNPSWLSLTSSLSRANHTHLGTFPSGHRGLTQQRLRELWFESKPEIPSAPSSASDPASSWVI